MNKKRIVYVNFAPYDNAGRILDFLVNNFSLVLHFSYDHLRLKNGRRSILFIYKDGEQIFKKDLLWMRTPSPLLFFSLPLVAIAIIWQTFWEVRKYANKYGKFHYYMTVNAYTACIGNLLRSLKYIKKTIFWVWDYFPPYYPDWRLRLARKIYWQLDNPAINSSNSVIFLNKKLAQIRQKLNVISPLKKLTVIPIGTNPINKIYNNDQVIIGHMGMLKWGQGLDLLFDALPELKKKIKNLKVEIIGSGPDEIHFRERAKKFSSFVKFYGYIQNDDDVDNIIKNWQVGIATYIPDKSSEHYWTDPSKIKAYINQGVPVITTAVPEFANEVVSNKAGIIIDYYNINEFLEGITNLIKLRNFYSQGAIKLAKKYHYKKIYPNLFKK